jgi:hypothetical protein
MTTRCSKVLAPAGGTAKDTGVLVQLGLPRRFGIEGLGFCRPDVSNERVEATILVAVTHWEVKYANQNLCNANTRKTSIDTAKLRGNSMLRCAWSRRDGNSAISFSTGLHILIALLHSFFTWPAIISLASPAIERDKWEFELRHGSVFKTRHRDA